MVALVCFLQFPKVLHVALVRFPHVSKILPKVLHVALVIYVTLCGPGYLCYLCKTAYTDLQI